jgi:hypothetical protein
MRVREHGAVDKKYRIKNESESFERIVLECDLSASDMPESMYSVVRPRCGAAPAAIAEISPPPSPALHRA